MRRGFTDGWMRNAEMAELCLRCVRCLCSSAAQVVTVSSKRTRAHAARCGPRLPFGKTAPAGPDLHDGFRCADRDRSTVQLGRRGILGDDERCVCRYTRHS